jgi:hypothetical protein
MQYVFSAHATRDRGDTRPRGQQHVHRDAGKLAATHAGICRRISIDSFSSIIGNNSVLDKHAIDSIVCTNLHVSTRARIMCELFDLCDDAGLGLRNAQLRKCHGLLLRSCCHVVCINFFVYNNNLIVRRNNFLVRNNIVRNYSILGSCHTFSTIGVVDFQCEPRPLLHVWRNARLLHGNALRM